MFSKLRSDSSFATTTLSTFALRIGFIGAGFVVTLVYTHWLGAEILGFYNYCISWVILAVVAIKLGFEEYITRELAACNALGDANQARYVWRFTLTAVSALAVISAVALITFVWRCDSIDPDRRYVYTLAASLLPLLSISELYRGKLRSANKVLYTQFSDAIVRPLILCMGGIAFFALTGRPREWQPFAITLLAAIAVLTLYIWKSATIRPVTELRKEPPCRSRLLLSAGLPFVFIASLQVLNQRIDRVMLGNFENMTTVGIYSIAVQIASLVSLTMVAVNLVIGPKIAALHAAGTLKSLQSTVLRSTNWATAGSLGLLVMLGITGHWILGIFGQEFEAAYWPLIILSVGQFTNAAAGPTEPLMAMCGYEKTIGFLVATAALLNLTLNFFLIPSYGIVGASIATSLSLSIKNLIVVVATHLTTGIAPTSFVKFLFLKMRKP